MTKQNNIPAHVAIVMDGNGRWAKKRLLPRMMGHKAGADTVKKIIQASAEIGIKVLTLFAFSSENWRRPQEEVDHLMGMFLTRLEQEIDELNANNIRIRFIGDHSQLNVNLQQRIQEAEALTHQNYHLQVVVALNYGGQWDILQACQKIYHEAQPEFTPDNFQRHLSTGDLPPVDLFIRTSGEIRISNFLLWQIAYAELYFTDTLWPDFDAAALKKALEEYTKRQRRFGDVG
jgi:undecaprenyl diphosphate synthase